MVHYEKEAMFCFFIENLIRQTPLHRQKGEPLMFGLEPTEELVDVCLPVIKKEIALFKEMPKYKAYDIKSSILCLNVIRKKVWTPITYIKFSCLYHFSCI